MTDEEFISALQNCQLAASEFNHAAHVRAGYVYLRQHKFAHALSHLTTSIRRFAESLGKSAVYHETTTPPRHVTDSCYPPAHRPHSSWDGQLTSSYACVR